MMNVLKSLVIAGLILTSAAGFAQTKKKKPTKKQKVLELAAPDSRVDTMRLSNLAPGMDARFIESYAQGAQIDTMMWGGEEGASILRFDGKFMGYRGRYVIGLKGRLIDQVAFNMIPMSKDEATGAFAQAETAYRQSLGTPFETYANVLRTITWQSKAQKFVLQTKDDIAYFAAVLTYAPPPKSQPKSGPKNWWEK
jgi:hypothetical protein